MSRAVRFRVPDGSMRFDDQIHGPIEFDGANGGGDSGRA
jgi:hypothetical protein